MDDKFYLNEINPYILGCINVNPINCPPTGEPFPPRTTRWFELELITWGDGYIVTEGKRHNVRKGNLFFRPPGVKVQGFAPYYCYLVVFDISYDPAKEQIYQGTLSLNNDAEPRNEDKLWKEIFPMFKEVIENPVWEMLFRQIFEENVQSGKHNQFTLKTLLMQLLHKLYESRIDEAVLATRHHSLRRHLNGILKAKAYIDNRPASCFNLEELSALAGLSENFFCTAFKKIVGESPIVYANRVKINVAKSMLIQTNDSIKDISSILGFNNVTYFHRLFKSMEGFTPQQYRDQTKMQ